jgi:ornithine carbamoyltransferase
VRAKDGHRDCAIALSARVSGTASRLAKKNGERTGEVPVADLGGRDYIETRDFAVEEIEHLLATAAELKAAFHAGRPTIRLPNQTVFLLFFDKSTRTRNAFEAGATQLGAHAHFLEPGSLQISHGESAGDTGIILGRMGHGIAIRHDLIPGVGNAYLREVARHADVPVINMQCDVDHPTQTLADLMTIRERFGKDLRGKRIAVSWAYAPSYAKPLSVPQGLISLMPRMGLDVTLAHPPGYDLMSAELERARVHARQAGVKFEVVDSMDEALTGADIVYPKSWGTYDLMVRKRDATDEQAITEIESQCLEITCTVCRRIAAARSPTR